MNNDLVQVAAITREKGAKGSIFRTFHGRSSRTLLVENSVDQSGGYDGPLILLERSATTPTRFSTDSNSIIEKHFGLFGDDKEQRMTIIQNAPIALADLVGVSDPLLSLVKRLSQRSTNIFGTSCTPAIFMQQIKYF